MNHYPSQKIPLASRMLLHRKKRFVLAVLGIAFSVVIMFMEIGFFNGINDSQSNLLTLMNADLLLMSKKRFSMLERNTIPRVRLSQASVLNEISETIPFYETEDHFLNHEDKRIRTISILAFPQNTKSPLRIKKLDKYVDPLKINGNVLYDSLSRKIYGKIKPGNEINLGGRSYKVIGEVKIGPSISLDGYILMGEETFFSHTGNIDQMSLGLIRLKSSADIETVKQKLRGLLPEDTIIMTPKEAKQREVDFTIKSTPTVQVFGVGVVIGFIIGVIICYQILFNEITDHLPQYATMKAVGFSKKFLTTLVMKQSLFLSLAGFVPGLIGG